MKSLLMFLMLPSLLAAQAAGRIAVGANVHVSHALPMGTHDEVLIGADPENASRLVACSIVQPDLGIFDLRTVVYASTDGGNTWSPPLLIDSAGIDKTTMRPANSADPGCAFGVNGAMHFVRLPAFAYWSTDGGKTWGVSKVPVTGGTDRTNIVADHTGGKYHGRVYFYAQMSGQPLDEGYITNGITLWRSLDGGKTFERPVQRFPADHSGLQPGTSVVLADGTWAAVTRHLVIPKGSEMAGDMTSSFKVITSTDGGETLNEAVTVAGPYTSGQRAQVPAIAADTHSVAFKNRMYVVWSDFPIGGRYQVMLAYSADRGKTWSTPRAVNDDLHYREARDLEQSVGRVSVAANNDGVVGVLWEDRRENASNDRGFALRFAASLDGGDTFLPSVRVSEKPREYGDNVRWLSSIEAFPWSPKTSFDVTRTETGGHTIGMAADIGGVFHPLWTDNRTGVSQVWTATVKVDGRVTKFGNQALATLSDLSNKVKIEVLGSSYDEATHRVTVRTRLRNESTDTLRGPTKVRALLMLSEATVSGSALAVGADNRESGTGATWDFMSQVAGGILPPSAVTQERSLVFELSNLRPTGAGKKFSYGSPLPYRLMHFEGQVLGSGKKADTIYP